MIDTIIFDIGNVLAAFEWEQYLIDRGYSNEIIQRVGNATVSSALWKEIDRSVYMEELVKDFVANDPGVAEEIIDFLENSYGVVKEYGYSKDLVKKLKAKGYKVYLLSNYGGHNYRYARDNFSFIEYVDGGLISYEVGYVKPEPEIYEAIINRYNIIPGEAVFLDDLPQNIEAAKQFGFNTILFNDLQQALDDMKELGITL